jgi:hypothetical protein
MDQILRPVPQHVSPDLQKILADKRNLRRDLAARPIAEKLRLLDSLRDREVAIRTASGRSGEPTAVPTHDGTRTS